MIPRFHGGSDCSKDHTLSSNPASSTHKCVYWSLQQSTTQYVVQVSRLTADQLKWTAATTGSVANPVFPKYMYLCRNIGVAFSTCNLWHISVCTWALSPGRADCQVARIVRSLGPQLSSLLAVAQVTWQMGSIKNKHCDLRRRLSVSFVFQHAIFLKYFTAVRYSWNSNCIKLVPDKTCMFWKQRHPSKQGLCGDHALFISKEIWQWFEIVKRQQLL